MADFGEQWDDEERQAYEQLDTTTKDSNPYTDCRMYENEFPEADDFVMVRVTRMTDINAYVMLLEYNNKEGIILFSQLSRKRIRSVAKHIRVGKVEVLQVLRVDSDKGYIDLSKKLMQKEEIEMCEERYKKSKTVHSILSRVAQNNQYPLLDLYEKVGWPLSHKYGHTLEAFKEMVQDEGILEPFDIPKEVKEDLLKLVKHRLAIHPVKIQADIEVTCFTAEGIDAIKAALHAGLEKGQDQEHPVRIQLFSTPVYFVYIITPDKNAGIATLNLMAEAVKEKIQEAGGNFAMKNEPRIVQA